MNSVAQRTRDHRAAWQGRKKGLFLTNSFCHKWESDGMGNLQMNEGSGAVYRCISRRAKAPGGLWAGRHFDLSS